MGTTTSKSDGEVTIRISSGRPGPDRLRNHSYNEETVRRAPKRYRRRIVSNTFDEHRNVEWLSCSLISVDTRIRPCTWARPIAVSRHPRRAGRPFRVPVHTEHSPGHEPSGNYTRDNVFLTVFNCLTVRSIALIIFVVCASAVVIDCLQIGARDPVARSRQHAFSRSNSRRLVGNILARQFSYSSSFLIARFNERKPLLSLWFDLICETNRCGSNTSTVFNLK